MLADKLNDIIKGLAVFDPLLKQIDDRNATGEHKVDQKKSVENIKFFVIYF